MPSPYATQRPTTTRASCSSERTTSRARRDLPIPGGPTIVASRHEDSRTAVSNARRSSSSSRSRPMKGVTMGRAKAGMSGRSAEQPPRGERLALSLRLDSGHRLDDDRIPDEAVRRLAEEHLARLRGLFEPRRDVDRVACRELLIRVGVPDDHLARVDAGARGDANPVLAREILVDALESLAHLERRPHGAERIVLVDGRHAEHGHDRVADELLDGAAVSFERCLHRVEVAPHHPPQRLGVEPLAERRRVGDVREDDRDHLPRLGVARLRVELRAARVAEPCVGVVLAPAGTTDHEADPTFRTSGAPPVCIRGHSTRTVRLRVDRLGHRAPGQPFRCRCPIRDDLRLTDRASSLRELLATGGFERLFPVRDVRGIERGRRSFAPKPTTKDADLQVFYGSDGTRTRDLRRDRLVPLIRRLATIDVLSLYSCGSAGLRR